MRRLGYCFAFACTLLCSLPAVFAENFATVPQGFLTLNIAAGTGSTRTLNIISLPLEVPGSGAGQMTGRITWVGTDLISNETANWTPGELSSLSQPHCIRITSGAATGRSFLIAKSSADQLTIDSEDVKRSGSLNTLGILADAINGDTYEILKCDTLKSLFGSPEETGVKGGRSAAEADIVQLLVLGAWREYYYSTTLARWARVGPNTDSDNQVIRPDTAIIYNRLGATPLAFAFAGIVPSTTRRASIKNSGVTFLSSGWPTILTLGNFGLHQLADWKRASNYASADIVQIFISGAWREYYHDGVSWRRVGPNTVSDGVAIPVGSGVIINKRGASTSSSTLTQEMPYSL